IRSTPAVAASSKTRRDPSTFSSRVAPLALRIAKARWTTTSAPSTRSRTLAASVTSPCRYSVLRQPRSAGSNGRRAMPTIRLTERERSSASTMLRPRSPVGPVTATVSPVVAMPRFLSDAGGQRPRSASGVDLLASAEEVDRVGRHRVSAGAAAHAVALAVARADVVVARAGVDRVGIAAAGHAVGGRARPDPVAPGAAEHLDASTVGDHHVVAGARSDRRTALGRLHPIGAGAGVHEVAAQIGVDAVGAGSAEEPVGVGLAEQRIGARPAQHEVVPRAGVHDVVVGPRVDAIRTGAADHDVGPISGVDLVVAAAGLEVVVEAMTEQAVLPP